MVDGPSFSTLLTFPPLPLDSYASEKQPDTWTRTGWTRAHVRHLFDAIFTWDYLPFCLLDKDLFIRDYESNSTRFCSSALVYATLAISARLINENDNEKVLPSGWLSSKLFCDEAKKALQQAEQSTTSLPDVQALGILSLYYLRCGLETTAMELALSFYHGITDICEGVTPESQEDELYNKVRTVTLHGAGFLIRWV